MNDDCTIHVQRSLLIQARFGFFLVFVPFSRTGSSSSGAAHRGRMREVRRKLRVHLHIQHLVEDLQVGVLRELSRAEQLDPKQARVAVCEESRERRQYQRHQCAVRTATRQCCLDTHLTYKNAGRTKRLADDFEGGRVGPDQRHFDLLRRHGDDPAIRSPEGDRPVRVGGGQKVPHHRNDHVRVLSRRKRLGVQARVVALRLGVVSWVFHGAERRGVGEKCGGVGTCRASRSAYGEFDLGASVGSSLARLAPYFSWA